jgi:hypothetical protein
VVTIEPTEPRTPSPLVYITLSRGSCEIVPWRFHFAFGGVFDGLLGRIGAVFDELGDFDGVAEQYWRDLRHIVSGAGSAAQVAALLKHGKQMSSRS